jgi:S1-C subfamily serine protease
LLRNKKSKEITVELKNSQGNTEVVKDRKMDMLGAAFEEVSEQTRKQLNIGYGLQVSGVDAGKFQKAGIQRGFIILKVNNVQIRTEKDLENVFSEAIKTPEQVLFITGIYPSGRRANFAIDLSE